MGSPAGRRAEVVKNEVIRVTGSGGTQINM